MPNDSIERTMHRPLRSNWPSQPAGHKVAFAKPQESATDAIVRKLQCHHDKLERRRAVSFHESVLKRHDERQRRLRCVDHGLVAQLRAIAAGGE